MDETIASFPGEHLTGWIFDEVVDLFSDNQTVVEGHAVPNKEFFNTRK